METETCAVRPVADAPQPMPAAPGPACCRLVISKEKTVLSAAAGAPARLSADLTTALPIMKQPLFWTPPATDGLDIAAKCSELDDRLQRIAGEFGDVRLASSLAVEDMVLTDALARLRLPITVFTLDTGCLHAETLALLPQIHARYRLTVAAFAPDEAAAAAFLAAHGRGAMYESVALRRQCCQIRKIDPLNRALAGADAWLTGQRREQAATRGLLPFAEQDTARGMAKFNPLFDWSEAEVWAYARAADLPLNTLYTQGYPSIGCEPCTRPVKAGEDIRAGRWWWEQADSKECGLHK